MHQVVDDQHLMGLSVRHSDEVFYVESEGSLQAILPRQITRNGLLVFVEEVHDGSSVFIVGGGKYVDFIVFGNLVQKLKAVWTYTKSNLNKSMQYLLERSVAPKAD